MDQTWRSSLKQSIEKQYIQGPGEWFEINVSPSGLLNMVIISEHFKDQPHAERHKQLEKLMQQFAVPVTTGYISLYTPQEAAALEIKHTPTNDENILYSWFDLASWAANAHEAPLKPRHASRIPGTIVFYSFKGGVGRTTALIQVATILARRGRKVVTVDLDLEAPGLSNMSGIIQPPYGIVDYFYERSYIPEDIKPDISITDICSEVPLINAAGQLFVVPAGKLDLDYLAKLDDLRANAVNGRGEDLWTTFYNDITEQLHPDIILVDSRTGLNAWGAFSLLRVADKAIMFLYPSEQNWRGLRLLIQALADILPTSFVFSPVPSPDASGIQMVKKHWSLLQTYLEKTKAEIAHALPINNTEAQRDSNASSYLVEMDHPIVIPYLADIALADSYPVEELLRYYNRIANLIDEDTDEMRYWFYQAS